MRGRERGEAHEGDEVIANAHRRVSGVSGVRCQARQVMRIPQRDRPAGGLLAIRRLVRGSAWQIRSRQDHGCAERRERPTAHRGHGEDRVVARGSSVVATTTTSATPTNAASVRPASGVRRVRCQARQASPLDARTATAEPAACALSTPERFKFAPATGSDLGQAHHRPTAGHDVPWEDASLHLPVQHLAGDAYAARGLSNRYEGLFGHVVGMPHMIAICNRLQLTLRHPSVSGLTLASYSASGPPNRIVAGRTREFEDQRGFGELEGLGWVPLAPVGPACPLTRAKGAVERAPSPQFPKNSTGTGCTGCTG